MRPPAMLLRPHPSQSRPANQVIDRAAPRSGRVRRLAAGVISGVVPQAIPRAVPGAMFAATLARALLFGAAAGLAGCAGTPRPLPPPHHHHGYRTVHRTHGGGGTGASGGAMWISPSLAAAIKRARAACDNGEPGACDRLRALLSEGFAHGPVPPRAP